MLRTCAAAGSWGSRATGRLPGWRPERRGDEDGREGVAKRAGSERKAARGRRFLNLVYANLKLTRIIYA